MLNDDRQNISNLPPLIVPNYNLGLKTNDLNYLFFDINQVVCSKGRRIKSRHLPY